MFTALRLCVMVVILLAAVATASDPLIKEIDQLVVDDTHKPPTCAVTTPKDCLAVRYRPLLVRH
jgi:hypothetical protein